MQSMQILGSPEFNVANLLDSSMESGFSKPVGPQDSVSEVLGSWLGKNQSQIMTDGQFSDMELRQLVQHLEGTLSSKSSLSTAAKGELKTLIAELKTISKQWSTDLGQVSTPYASNAINTEQSAAVVKALAPFDKSGSLAQDLQANSALVGKLPEVVANLMYVDKHGNSDFESVQTLEGVITRLNDLQAMGLNLTHGLGTLKSGLESALKKYNIDIGKIAENTGLSPEQRSKEQTAAMSDLRAEVARSEQLADSSASGSGSSSRTSGLAHKVYNHNTLADKLNDGSWRPADFAAPKSYTVSGLENALTALEGQRELALSAKDQLALNHIDNKIRLIETDLNSLKNGTIVAGDMDVAALSLTKNLAVLDFATLTGMRETLKAEKANMPAPLKTEISDEKAFEAAQKTYQENQKQIDNQISALKVDMDTVDRIMASIQDAIEKTAQGKADAYSRAYN